MCNKQYGGKNMSTPNIPSINNAGVMNSSYLHLEDKAKQEVKQEVKPDEQKKKEVPTETFLSYLSYMNNDIPINKVTRTYDISKYVSPEQAERIGEFVETFEADFDAAYDMIQDEFGGNISGNAAKEIALAQLDLTYQKD